MVEHTLLVEMFYDGTWNDITADVLVQEGVTLARELSDETLEPRPGRVALSVLNPSGKYNPNNPVSPLYGAIGLNTPIRVAVDGDVQQVAEVAEYRPSRPLGFTSRCALVGAGVLRRLGRGKTPLRPALERAVLAGGPAGYWRLDDAAGAVQAASALSEGRPLAYTADVRPGVVEGTDPLGGGKYPNFMAGDGQTVSGILASEALPTVNTTGYAVDAMIYLDGELSFTNVLTVYSTSTSIGGGFSFRVSSLSGSLNVELEPLDLALPGPFVTDLALGQWHHVRGVALNAGSAMELHLYVNGDLVDTESYAASAAGRAESLIVGGDDFSGFNTAEELSVGHVAVWDTSTPDSGPMDAGSGYLGEPAAERAVRLAAENGIPLTVVGTAADSHPMGPQRTDTLTELLLEAVRTDAAMLSEDRDSRGFVFRTGRALCNQDPVISLDFAGEQIAPPLEPEISDPWVRNDVEAKSPDGATGRHVLLDGPMSVQDPPDGVGRYDTTWDVNPADPATLPDHAAWHVNRGTVQETRFASVTIDLDAAPGLAADVAVLELGDLVEITNLDPADSPESARGLLIGITQRVLPFRRLVTLTTVPAAPYEVGLRGADDGSVDVRGARRATDLSTLSAGVTSSATSLSVATTGGVLWTTDADDWNPALNGGGLFITIGGETMRVTNIAGASSPQTFTVVRSINGVVKAHSAGAAVHVRYPIKRGL